MANTAVRKLIVEVVGDSTSLERTFNRSQTAGNGFARSVENADKSLGKAVRGAAAGSGVFRSLGRSLAFASGGFLAFATAGEFIRKSLDASKEAAVVQAQLSAQFKASGQALAPYQKQIDETTSKLSALAGFENDELKAAFTTIFRTTSNVNKSLRDTATAADLARAKHLSLSQAALIVAKTEAGNTTLLRRQGIQIAQNATAEQALATLRRTVAGQAAAGTTEQERFGAVLHETEEIIGAGLLPILNRYLIAGTQWLEQMNESGRLQEDVAKAANAVAQAVSLGVDAFKKIGDVIGLADKATGSFENTLKTLAGVYLLLKTNVIQAAIAMGELAAAEEAAAAAAASQALTARIQAYTGLAAAEKIATAATVEQTAATEAQSAAAVAATGRAAALRTALLSIGRIGALIIPIEFIVHKEQIDSFLKSHHLGFAAHGLIKDITDQFKSAPQQPGSPAFNGRPQFPLAPPSFTNQAQFPQGTGAGRPTSLQGLFNLDELKLATAEGKNQQKLVRSILVDEAGIVEQQEKSAKTLKQRTQFAQTLSGILDQIRSIDKDDATKQKQAADAAKAAAKKREEAEKKALAAALARRQASQFRALGLDASGGPLVPATAALKKELGNVNDAIQGTFLDTNKTQSVLSKIRRVVSGGLGAVTKDVRAQIKSMLDDLQQQLKDNADQTTKLRHLNTNAVIQGVTGLTPEQIKQLRSRLNSGAVAQNGQFRGSALGGLVPVTAAGASGDNVIETTINIDSKPVAKAVTRQQQRSKKRNPRQRRGFSGNR